MSFGADKISMSGAGVGVLDPYGALIRSMVEEINGAYKGSELEARIDEMIERIAGEIYDLSELNKVLMGIASGIEDTVTKELFKDKIAKKMVELSSAPRTNEKPAPLLPEEPRSSKNTVPMGGPLKPVAPASNRQGAGPAQVDARENEIDPEDGEHRAIRERMQELQAELQKFDGSPEARGVQEADSNYSHARSDEAGRRSELRGRDQALESEKKKRESYLNDQIKALSERLGLSEQRLRAAWDLAMFYKEKWDRDLMSSLKQAVLELFCENQNRMMEIVRVLHAVFMKMNDATLGTRTSASGVFSPQMYFSPKQPATDQWSDAIARAQAQGREFDAEKAQFERISKDPYHDRQVADAESKLAAANQEHEESKSALDAAEAGRAQATEMYEEHRARKSGILDEYRRLEKRMWEIREEKKKQNSAV